ncbi:Putative protein [Zobellia galactanivorans]|uniref:Uncharacterized protein n=1 Tax=Zobellia galactanivorans (strain DSM 12802 / CCUG 47099 / CIP 106680 / NCIMB 13871 / Dsij) TaxID=63186 RepID=G0L0D7_ZOBGA|nr:Putative protein [Zobellia galactanivorans]
MFPLFEKARIGLDENIVRILLFLSKIGIASAPIVFFKDFI